MVGFDTREYEGESNLRAIDAAGDTDLDLSRCFLELNEVRYKRCEWIEAAGAYLEAKRIVCDVFMCICKVKGKQVQEVFMKGVNRFENRMEVRLYEDVVLE
jgi:hypothetical protein